MGIGRGLRPNKPLEKEVQFSIDNGFSLMQVWFYKGEILIDAEDKINYIKRSDHPFILHAVMTAKEMVEDIDILIENLLLLNHQEVIIHPVLENRRTPDSLNELNMSLMNVVEKLNDHDIKLFLENNSMATDINHRLDDMRVLYNHPDVHLLLDIAHIASYDHLEGILKIKYPEKIHIADKRMHMPHEHLPIGQGELDFYKIFKILKAFKGDIIIELDVDDDVLLESLSKIRGFMI